MFFPILLFTFFPQLYFLDSQYLWQHNKFMLMSLDETFLHLSVFRLGKYIVDHCVCKCHSGRVTGRAAPILLRCAVDTDRPQQTAQDKEGFLRIQSSTSDMAIGRIANDSNMCVPGRSFPRHARHARHKREGRASAVAAESVQSVKSVRKAPVRATLCPLSVSNLLAKAGPHWLLPALAFPLCILSYLRIWGSPFFGALASFAGFAAALCQ